MKKTSRLELPNGGKIEYVLTPTKLTLTFCVGDFERTYSYDRGDRIDPSNPFFGVMGITDIADKSLLRKINIHIADFLHDYWEEQRKIEALVEQIESADKVKRAKRNGRSQTAPT